MPAGSRYNLGMNNPDHALGVRELNHVALHVPFGGAWYALGSQELHLIVADPTRQGERQAFHFALQVEDAYAASDALR